MTEILAVFDDAGQRLGTKSREAVHRDHDWHWLAFVWSAWVAADGRAQLLLQQRGRPDDPFYGNVDCPAAGHVSADESHLEGALREFDEEVGIQLAPHELHYLYRAPLQNPGGVCRRAIQHFYLCHRPLGLDQVRCSDEATGFIQVDLADFTALVQGQKKLVEGVGSFADTGPQQRPVQVTAAALASFNPAIMANFRRSLLQIGQLLAA